MKIHESLIELAHKSVPLESLMVLPEIEDGGKGVTKKERRILKVLIGKEIWEYFCEICSSSSIDITLDKSSSLNLALIIYLLGAGQHISYSLIKHYNVFARLFRNCFYHHAAEISDFCFKREIKEIDIEECRMAPVISDFFIRFYVPS